MIAVFLAAEASSERYGPRIHEILTRLGQPYDVAACPDTGDDAASAVRRQVLAGYPSGDVLTGMPADVAWHHAALTPAELATVRHLDYPVLDRFLRWHPAGRRRGPPPGPLAGPASRDDLPADCREPPRRHLPPTMILLGEPGPANLVVIEGHKRLTGLLVCPHWLPAELSVLLGITAGHHK